MTFFNSKEEVLDIELTKYGQFMLSQGKFKPTYYAFFDDDILYDSSYAYVTESQNDIEPRIQETPRMKTQYLYSGVETNYNLMKQFTGGSEPIVTQHDADTVPGGSVPLGKSKYGEQKYPAWSIQAFDGEISSVAIERTGSYLSYNPVPEVTLLCQVFTGDSSVLSPSDHGGVDGLVTIASEPYDDDTYLILNSDELLLRIEEKNTDFQVDNFEVEVYEVVTHTMKGKDYERARRLVFSSALNGDDIADPDQFKDNEVEYYMTILADHEIPTSVFCSKVPKELRESYFMGSSYECADNDKIRGDIYTQEEKNEDPC